MVIYEQKTFVSEDGGSVIHELRPQTGEWSPSKFYAMITIVIQPPNHPPMPHQFKLDIEAGSIAEAFLKLPDLIEPAAKKRLEEMEAHARQQAAIASRRIILPDGKPVVTGKPKTRIA